MTTEGSDLVRKVAGRMYVDNIGRFTGRQWSDLADDTKGRWLGYAATGIQTTLEELREYRDQEIGRWEWKIERFARSHGINLEGGDQ